MSHLNYSYPSCGIQGLRNVNNLHNVYQTKKVTQTAHLYLASSASSEVTGCS